MFSFSPSHGHLLYFRMVSTLSPEPSSTNVLAATYKFRDSWCQGSLPGCNHRMHTWHSASVTLPFGTWGVMKEAALLSLINGMSPWSRDHVPFGHHLQPNNKLFQFPECGETVGQHLFRKLETRIRCISFFNDDHDGVQITVTPAGTAHCLPLIKCLLWILYIELYYCCRP